MSDQPPAVGTPPPDDQREKYAQWFPCADPYIPDNTSAVVARCDHCSACREYERLCESLAELTRLRAELDDLKAKNDELLSCPSIWCPFEKKAHAYTTLLVDLRAIIEQWKAIPVFFTSSGRVDPDLSPENESQASQIARHVYGICADLLKARLSREPHQDTPQ